MRPLPRPARGRLALAAVAALAALVLPAAAAAQAPPAVPTGTPVLGATLLSPAQIAAWYAATGITSRSPTPVERIAQLFVEEGHAQGVRGDIAFAQAMLETGYLRFGGQVVPADNNFGGIGACDSCDRGLRFPDPETGIRAHVQHLWAYASPTADAAGAGPAGGRRPLRQRPAAGQGAAVGADGQRQLGHRPRLRPQGADDLARDARLQRRPGCRPRPPPRARPSGARWTSASRPPARATWPAGGCDATTWPAASACWARRPAARRAAAAAWRAGRPPGRRSC